MTGDSRGRRWPKILVVGGLAALVVLGGAFIADRPRRQASPLAAKRDDAAIHGLVQAYLLDLAAKQPDQIQALIGTASHGGASSLVSQREAAYGGVPASSPKVEYLDQAFSDTQVVRITRAGVAGPNPETIYCVKTASGTWRLALTNLTPTPSPTQEPQLPAAPSTPA